MSVKIIPERRHDEVATGSISGPNPYATGGFTLDLSASFIIVDAWKYIITNQGSLGVHRLEHSISGLVVTIKIILERYDSVSSIGNAFGQPAGVTLATVSGQTVANESAHTHSIDHDHASTTSAVSSNAGVAVNTLGGISGIANHQHDWDLANLVGTSGAGGAHNHVINFIYTHSHSSTLTETNCPQTELVNGFNASGSNWRWLAKGTLTI